MQLTEKEYNCKKDQLYRLQQQSDTKGRFHNCNQEMGQAQNLSEIFYQLRSLDSRNIEISGIPEKSKNYFDLAVEAAKEIETAQIYEEYEICNLKQLLQMEILSMIQADTMIRKCRNCGKYFAVSNRKTAYCDRIDESGDRCSAIGIVTHPLSLDYHRKEMPWREIIRMALDLDYTSHQAETCGLHIHVNRGSLGNTHPQQVTRLPMSYSWWKLSGTSF